MIRPPPDRGVPPARPARGPAGGRGLDPGRRRSRRRFYGLGGKKLIEDELKADQHADAATVDAQAAKAAAEHASQVVDKPAAAVRVARANLDARGGHVGVAHAWQADRRGVSAPGPEAVIVLRPAELLKNPQAEKLLDPKVLGPLADWVHTQLPALAGTGLENIEQVIVGLLESGGATRLALVVHLKEPVPQETLLKAWGDPAAEKVDGKTFYQKQDLAYYVPQSKTGRVISIAPTVEMRDVVASDGQAALLPLHVERLLHQSDGDRLLTAIIGPGLMSTAGKGLFSGAAARLKEPVEWFLTGADPSSPMPMAEPKAMMFSCNFTPDFFAELRDRQRPGRPRLAGCGQGHARPRQGAVKKVTLGVRSLDWTPYSENVLVDLPDMTKAVQQFTRVGTATRRSCCEPTCRPRAAPNLALATYLCLLENPRGSGATERLPRRADRKAQIGGRHAEQKNHDQLPAQHAGKMHGDDAGRAGRAGQIKGSDLQLDGITKNQSFGLDEHDKPAVGNLPQNHVAGESRR